MAASADDPAATATRCAKWRRRAALAAIAGKGSAVCSNRSAIAPAKACNAARLWAESTTNAAGGLRPAETGAAGGCSITTWALVPPIPKEFTPARRGVSLSGQALVCTATWNGLAAKSISGLGVS